MFFKANSIEKVLKRFPNRGRFHFFLLFVFISFTFWLITKLSNNYEINQKFIIQMRNVPREVVLFQNDLPLELSISASGVEILWYRLFHNTIEVDLSRVDFSVSPVRLVLDNQLYKIKQQLLSGTQLNEINTPILEVTFSNLDRKKVKVVTQSTLNFRPGFMSDTALESTPDSVWVVGPKKILDSLTHIKTLNFSKDDTNSSINEKWQLQTIEGLHFETNAVQLKMSVSRYSEKEFSIPLEVINLPKGMRVKLFPPKVKLRATMPLSLLGGIQNSDFRMAVDYHQILDATNNKLSIQLVKGPPGIKKAVWEPEAVNYLIRK
jgi:hypothetical protein